MLKYVIGIPLIVHGLANMAGFIAAWTSADAGFTDRPWLFSEDITMSSPIGRVFGLFWLLTTIGLIAAGIGVLINASWWQAVAISAAALSLLTIVCWWNTVPPGARFGAFFDLFVIVVLLLPWGKELTRAVP